MLTTGQSWLSWDSSTSDFVNEAVKMFHDLIDAKLDAICLHGSLAMGCFYPPKSDVDCLYWFLNQSAQKSTRLFTKRFC